MSDSTTPVAQDFEAALHEIESNVDVRRLMIVVVHVLVPASAVALVNALCAPSDVRAVAWLSLELPWILGIVLAVGGVWTSAILTRCHFGLVVNGTKMAKVRSGVLELRGLNWLGVTTNFLGLTALSAAGGAVLCGAAVGRPWFGAGVGLALVVGLLGWLRVQHARANRLCRKLDASWQSGPVPAGLQEEHARKSLDATNADVSVVVTMAAALFAGAIDAISNLGNLSPAATAALRAPDLDTVQRVAAVALAAITFVSLGLSARIVVRLRVALAEHSERLAALRSEPDTPWRFDPRERSFLLFLVVVTLASIMGLIAVWSVAGRPGGIGFAAGFALVSVLWYPLQLRAAARRARRRAT
ncbi:MAG: hypothetical protein IPM29_22090 [Planctomycetes bacterium]|nr:hypothetical protein [Planctomycetota bacterium]